MIYLPKPKKLGIIDRSIKSVGLVSNWILDKERLSYNIIFIIGNLYTKSCLTYLLINWVYNWKTSKICDIKISDRKYVTRRRSLVLTVMSLSLVSVNKSLMTYTNIEFTWPIVVPYYNIIPLSNMIEPGSLQRKILV